jgi:hypothetical protein
MDAYCLKCRTRRPIKNAERIIMKNGRPATIGQCPVCGSKIYKIEKKIEKGAAQATVLAKEVTRSWLADVPADKVFWCHDGRVLKNLEELSAALREMSDETFAHHVTSDKNDFSKWVQEVIEDQELSIRLRNASSRSQAYEAVANRLSRLKR